MNVPAPRLPLPGALPGARPELAALALGGGLGGGADEGQTRTNAVRVWSAFRRRWWVPALCALVGLLALVAHALLRPPEYVAKGLVQLGMFAADQFDRSGRGSPMQQVFETHRQLLTSHAVVEDAIRRSGVELAQGPARREQRTLFLKGLTITPQVGTFLVEVEARDREPRRVVQKVNALMDAFIPFTNEFLNERLARRERQLREREELVLNQRQEVKTRLDKFYERVGAGQQGFQTRRQNLLQAHQQLLERQTGLHLETATAQTDKERLTRFLVDVKSEVEVELLAGRLGGEGRLRQNTRLDDLKVKLRDMERTLQPGNPVLAETREQLALEREAFRAELRDEAQAMLAEREERERTLVSEATKLQKGVEEFTSELSRLDLQEGEYRTIATELEWYDKELESTRSELRSVQSVGKGGDAGALIVNRAELPTEAEPRFKPINFAFLTALAFGFGLVLVVAWDHLDDTIRREDDALLLGLPIIGRVPHLDLRTLDEKAHLQGSTWTSEAFGLIRTNLTVAAGGIHKGAILVTSGTPRDGKSFVSANLATSLGRTGGRTLVIEADLRRPRLQKVFGTSYDEGLSDVLAGLRELGDVVQKTDFEGVDLLPAGPCPLNPADLLLRGQFDQLMRAALERYDHVIVDAPPARPLADTSLMAPYVKGVVHVTRINSSRRRLAAGAIEQIQAVGARSLGIILNDVPPRAEESYLAYGEYYTQVAERMAAASAPEQELFVVGLPMGAAEPPSGGGPPRLVLVLLVLLLLGGVPAALWWLGMFEPTGEIVPAGPVGPAGPGEEQ